jgi:hypothetical protein
MDEESTDSNNNKAFILKKCEFQKCWHRISAQLFNASYVNSVNAILRNMF